MDLEPPRVEQTEPGTTRAGQTGQISLTTPAHIGEQGPTTQGEQRQTTLGEQRQTTQGEPSCSQGPWQSRVRDSQTTSVAVTGQDEESQAAFTAVTGQDMES